ncbi:MAG: hypothetical protein R6V57_10750 [Vicinamibacterales bacterium]
MRSRTRQHTLSRAWRFRLTTACLAGCAAAAVGAVAIVAVYQWRPALGLAMDRPLPSGVRGFYPLERQGKTSFAWSGGAARLEFDHVDRRAPWACRADLINWRPPAAGPARIQIRSGGSLLADRLIVEPTAALDFTIPADPAASGIDLVIDVSPTFRPGPQDPRELGLAFDAIACEPAEGFRPRPAASVIARGAGAAAVAGAVAGLAGLPAAAALGAGSALAAAQAWSLATGGAVYSLASPPVYLLAGLFGLFCLVPVAVASGVLRRPLSTPALVAVVVSASGFYLKLIFLLHPDKDIVDAVFHAHRFEWVLAGRFYFTQLSTSATPFPYAIGLYVFSAPFALLTADHVTLLRIVVCAAEAAAGALLYPLILRAWGDRAMGAAAVLLFHLLPLPYAVIGNANLTNAFGQSAALVAMIAAISWSFRPRTAPALAGLTALASLAFLSHVGTLAFLLPTLLMLAALYYAAGGRDLRRPALSVLAATGLALLVAIGLYYGHFGDVYRPHIERARAAIAGTAGASEAKASPEPAQASKAPPLQLGVRGALDQTRGSLGWPIIVLALAGAWRLAARRRADRLVLGLGAWLAACAIFLGWSAMRSVEPRYVQDAWEFIGRVQLATSPAAAILAACGATWAWRSGLGPRVAGGALVGAAVWVAARALGAWIF